MRPKDHPDLRFDVIPKLFDAHFKVFVTSLIHVEEQLTLLPRQFCRMYTTRPLANQLHQYLRFRNANIKEQDFKVVEEGQPFPLILSDGKRLEAMLCSGSHLGHSLILLIRRQQGGRLLYSYSATRLDNLGRLLGNSVFNSWIAEGTEHLYLNLSSVNEPFEPVDFDEMAITIEEYATKKDNSVVCLNLPLFGYEEMLWKLAHTRLSGHIKLGEVFLDSYRCLSSDLERFKRKNYLPKVYVCKSLVHAQLMYRTRNVVFLELKHLRWSPPPTRMHLRQLCSLLRPQHIQGIVHFHSDGVVPHIPPFLKSFKANYSPQKDSLTSSKPQGDAQATAAKQGPYRAFTKRKRFEFLDDADDSNDSD
ncbi:uncharacterized protein LOC128257327 [Drosophila gunungcola]|uniref:uncharacterized protein LOC128257327 n=1 Tax=Drosophila gunungcola TaxID=103775 RepID=UPI0022E29A35|nr:uncharacterized protein LOC128257327 [Drosophila gunungcola]XP_052844259.1 uncharacterized protein LOC128257327 [Drosophila gunungcola]XP_052844260.1 uncharacterized protein LOC128257327 [Drosophila gunungcola]XP_052844261.1 uncharacterized protein LOC128257327 [Drosophila gunungcola]